MGEGFTSKPSEQLETPSDHFYFMSFWSVKKDRYEIDGICSESSEIGDKEEAPGCVLDLQECLPVLCLSSKACNVEKLSSVICREAFDHSTFAEYVSGETDFP